MSSIEPSQEAIEAFASAEESGAPVVMLNLLRYREAAEYPNGFDAQPCTGREAYERYGQRVAPARAAPAHRR